MITQGPNGDNFEKLNYKIPEITINSGNIFNYVGKSTFLSKLLNTGKDNINIFIQSFIDNIEFLKLSFEKSKNSKLTKEEKLVLDQFQNIDKTAKQETIKLANELVKDFLPKAFKIDDFVKSLKENSFLCQICYDKIASSGKVGEKIVFELYLLVINYLISYYRYLAKVSIYIGKNLEKLPLDIQNLIFEKTINNKDLSNLTNFEKDYLYQLLVVLYIELEKNNGKHVFLSLLNHLTSKRIKTPFSAVKKLLKSPKYREQYLKLGILPDQIGMLFIYEDIGELQPIAKYFKDHQENGFVGKFNDRGVLKQTDDNPDTIKGITPFVNTEIVGEMNDKEIPFGELSLRMHPKIQLDEILNSNLDDYSLIKELISKVDFLNHEIYKLSQDVKILRGFLIDKKILKTRNLEKSVGEYLNKQIKFIKNSILKEFPLILESYNKNISGYETMVELVINEVLKEKLEQVIYDLAWEKVIYDIKNTSSYKRLKDKDKRDYLKKLSEKFKKQIENPSSNTLGRYSDEIKNNIFPNFKRFYNEIKRSALFYKKVGYNISGLKKRIKIENKSKQNLLKDFK